MKDYAVMKASFLPHKEQITELSSQGWELVQLVEYKSEIFVYLERAWDGANIVIHRFEYNILEADSLPNQENLGDILTDGWELVQLIPFESKVYAYTRRLKYGVH